MQGSVKKWELLSCNQVNRRVNTQIMQLPPTHPQVNLRRKSWRSWVLKKWKLDTHTFVFQVVSVAMLILMYYQKHIQFNSRQKENHIRF